MPTTTKRKPSQSSKKLANPGRDVLWMTILAVILIVAHFMQ